MLVLACVTHHLGNLGLGDLEDEDAAHTFALGVHLQHYAGRRRALHAEDPFEHVDHEFHGSVIVIEQNDLIEGRLLDLGLGLFDDETALALHPFRLTHNPLTAMATTASGTHTLRRTFIGFDHLSRKGCASPRTDRICPPAILAKA